MITAHLASLPERLDSLRQVLQSLTGQVDHIYVALNGHKEIPVFDIPNVTYRIFDNSLGDAAKFAFFNEVEGFVLSCDDDLIYKNGYVSHMLYKYSQHPGCILSLHGKKFNRPATGAHRGFQESYHCFNPKVGDSYVDTGGTGVMLINTKDIKITLADFPHRNMADIWLGKLAAQQGVKIVVVEHSANLLQYITPATTIWRSHTPGDDAYQVSILNSFLK